MATNTSLLEAVVHAGEAERARLQREDAMEEQRVKARVWRDETVEAIESAKAARRATQKPFAEPKWRKMRYQEIDSKSAAEWIHFLVLNNREEEAGGYIERFVDSARRGVQDKLKQETEAAERGQPQQRVEREWTNEELHHKMFGSDDEEEEEEEKEEEATKENKEMEEEEEEEEVIEILDGVAVNDPEEIFTVERILKDKTVKGQKRYLVKWEGYDASYNSWEPRECFVDDSPITIYENNKPRKDKKRKEVVAQPQPQTQEEADAAFARELYEQDRRVRKKPQRVDPHFGKSNVAVKYI